MFLQVIVESLNLDGLQFGEPDITKRRNDVVLNDIRVAGDRIGPDIGLGIRLKPEVHPMPQSHIVIAFSPLVIWAGILLDGFGQFNCAFFLCLCKDTLLDPFSSQDIVAGSIPALPTPFISLPNTAY